MLSGKFILAVLIITVSITLVQWFFTGFLFHKYQKATPAAWRKEDNSSYVASIIISLVFAFLFTTLIYLWKSKYGPVNIFEGMKFGIICWAAFSLTIETTNAIYVNYSRMFVAGKCLSSLVEYVIAGAVAAGLL